MLLVAGQMWPAVIDTGFNGTLELPESMRQSLNARFIGRMSSLLAGNQSVQEDVYLVNVPFDGRTVHAEATFVSRTEILVGTPLLLQHRLEIHFPARTVVLEPVA